MYSINPTLLSHLEKMSLQVIYKATSEDEADAKIKIVMPFFGNTTVAQFVAGAVQRYDYSISPIKGFRPGT